MALVVSLVLRCWLALTCIGYTVKPNALASLATSFVSRAEVAVGVRVWVRRFAFGAGVVGSEEVMKKAHLGCHRGSQGQQGHPLSGIARVSLGTEGTLCAGRFSGPLARRGGGPI